MIQITSVQHGIRIGSGGSAGTAYHMPVVIRLRGALDPAMLARSAAAVVERHPVLASALCERDGVAWLDVADTAPALRIAGPGETVDEEIRREFDLSRGPLVRFALFQEPDEATLVVTAHHLAFDGHSKDVLIRDLAAAFNGRDQDPLPIGFADFAAAEQDRIDAEIEEAGRFWRERWTEPGPVFVGDAALSSRSAAPGSVVQFPLTVPDLPGLTAFETTLAALHAVLFRYGNGEVVTAVDLSTRTAETMELIGPFVNELPVFSRPAGGLPFTTFAASLRAELREIYRFRATPLARAVPRVRPHAALAPISVSYRSALTKEPCFDGLAAEAELLVFNGSVRGDLQLQIVDAAGSLTASLRYSARAAPVAERFAGHLQSVLAEIAADPGVRLADLDVPVAVATVPRPRPEPDPTVNRTTNSTTNLTTGPTPEPSTRPAADRGLSDVAAQLAQIWQEVLGLDRIGPDEDLFDLGGHSLTITQIIARMRDRLGIDLPLDLLFDNPTINGVLDAIDTA